jgi:GMP synthase (glutamine-hydrolysing)
LTARGASLLIVKTGCTLDPLRASGDFESWICAGMGVDPDTVAVADVFDGATLPDPTAPTGIVVTGSPAMVTDREPWSERTGDWLRAAITAGTPTLGICYGHQLIAQALGGRVASNPNGRQIGSVPFERTPGTGDDRLLGDTAALDDAFPIHVSHLESVVELPRGARLLGATPLDPNAAFSHGSAWGVQFHPEFDSDITRTYLRQRRQVLADEGIDADPRIAAVCECPAGPAILKRFASLCGDQTR